MNAAPTVPRSNRAIFILAGVLIIVLIGGGWLGLRLLAGQEPCGRVDSIFRRSGCQRILDGHDNVIWHVTFSPDGTLLASGALDSTIRLWRVSDGTLLHTLRADDHILTVAFAPDGALLASGGNDHTVQLWDVATGTLLKTLTGHEAQVNSVVFAPDGTTLASGASDGTVRLWNVAEGTVIGIWDAAASGVSQVAFSQDGSLVAAGGWGEERSIQMWRVADGAHLLTLPQHPADIIGLTFTTDGTQLLTASSDGTLQQWLVADGTLLQTQQVSASESLAFAPEGIMLAVGMRSSNIVELWSPDEARPRQTLDGSDDVPNTVHGLAFAPDGTLLAVTYGRRIWLWAVPR